MGSFTIQDITPTVHDIEVIDAEEVLPEPQKKSPLDEPLTVQPPQHEAPAVLFQLDDDSQDVSLQSSESEVKRFVLEMDEEPAPVSAAVMQTQASEQKPAVEVSKPFSPIDGTIEEGLSRRTEERKEKLKQFNYRFNQNSKLEDLEREPAYKRQEIDLDEPDDNDASASRTSLSTDSKDELQLRTNNSFLHDNVD